MILKQSIKKLTTAALSATLVFVLAACGGEGTANEPGTAEASEQQKEEVSEQKEEASKEQTENAEERFRMMPAFASIAVPESTRPSIPITGRNARRIRLYRRSRLNREMRLHPKRVRLP